MKTISDEHLLFYQQKTVLITGATGYLGTALAQVLSGVACRLILLAHTHEKVRIVGPGQAEIIWVQGNVAESETWRRVLDGVDIVFHLAAHEHKHGAQYNPILGLDVNSRSVLLLLEVCRERGLSPKIVFSSSSNIVGAPITMPVDETFPDNPPTLFAIHKSTAERYLQYYAHVYHLPSLALRLSNIYGPAPHPQIALRVTLNRIIHKALKENTITLFKNYACKRDYLFIDDAVNSFLASGGITEAHGQYYVIGSGEEYNISGAVNLIAERVALKTRHKPKIHLNEDVQIEKVEWRNFVADSTCFKSVTNWQPCVSLVDGIDRTIESLLITM